MRALRYLALLLTALLAACARPQPPVPYGPAALGVAKRGWHTEIVVPAAELSGPIASLGPARLHRPYLIIGYGARAYFTNPHAGAGTAAEALLPGPAAINLSAFTTLHEDSAHRQIIWLHVSQRDIDQLLAFVWHAMPRQGAAPPPIVIANNASMFYAATPDYNLFYNCNNWAVDALMAANLPFTNSGVFFSSEVEHQAARIAAAQHAGLQPRTP